MAEHIQTSDLRKLLRSVRNIDVSPEKAADIIIDYINNNYELKKENTEESYFHDVDEYDNHNSDGY